MSTTATQSAASLNGSQRDWLVKMGALLNAPVGADVEAPLSGGSPEGLWEKLQPALTDANLMVLDMDEANLSKVPIFKKGIALARSFAEQKRFAEAVQTFTALEPKIKEEFQKFQTSRGGGVQAKGGSADTTGAPSGPSPKGGETHPDDDPKAAEYKKQVLKVGSKGPAVEYLQKKLNLTGAKLEVDGKFGPETQKAVKAFQKSKQLKDDGIVGEKTWAALDGATPKPEPPKPTDTKPRKAVVIVTNSTSNDAVKDATVLIGTKSEKTGNTGQATLELPPGKYPYGVAADGFEQAIGTFEVTDKESSELRVELKGGAKPAASTTVLTVTPADKSNQGDKLLLTATVEFGPGRPALVGKVRFDVVLNGSLRQTLKLVDIQNGKATHTESKLPPGNHLLDAFFEPDPNNKGSQSAPVKHFVIDVEFQTQMEEAKKAVADLKSHPQSKDFTKEIAAIEAKVEDAQKKFDGRQRDAAKAQLKKVKFECAKTKASMDMVAGGATRARADQVAEISQSLVDAGIDPEKALEIGPMTETGGTGDIQDAKLVSQKFAKLPLDVIKTMRANGTKLVACRGNVTDARPELKGQNPGGHGAGATWDSPPPGVPGAYMPKPTNQVVVATHAKSGGGREVPPDGDAHASFDLTLHESIHGYDWGGATFKHNDADFQAARTKDFAKLDPYFTQPGEAGLSETYAESGARYLGGDPKMKKDWPNLYAYWDSQKK